MTANTSYVVLHLDKWDDHRCDILYFVVEYKLHAIDTWTTGEWPMICESASCSLSMMHVTMSNRA